MDGRHLTFLLTALGEAGYGVHVVGAPFVFRELMCLRKSAQIPFVVGGKEYEVGISITDKSGSNHRGHGEHGGGKRVLLDYDFFSGLTTKSAQEHETGKIIDSKIIETTEDIEVAAGQRLAGQAGADFSKPFTSEIAQDSENTSPTRSASGPAWARNAPEDRISQIGDRGAAVPPMADGGGLMAEGLAAALDRKPLCGGSGTARRPSLQDETNALDSRPSSLDSSSQALRAPYFMHPSVYHRGLHKRRERGAVKKSESGNSEKLKCWNPGSAALDTRRSTLDSAAKQRRRFRLGFFGTHDREFYTQHYHFPGMNRFEILEVFLQKFADRITPLRGFPRDWDPCEMAVSIDSRGGDRKGKSFLSQDHYFEALHECDFVLSPPGWCMPVSHNLIEAMFCGAIPITNGEAFMAEPLSDGETCLEFEDAEDFVSVIERALAMNEREVGQMRSSVQNYYERFLDPKAFAETFVHTNSTRILVNAEESSVPLAASEFKIGR